MKPADTPDIAASTSNGKVDAVRAEAPTVIDFGTAAKEPAPFFNRLPERWGLIAGLVGAAVAMATTATLVANALARRRVEPRRLFGLRPVRRYGVRHIQIPQGGMAWVAYLYRTPDIRVRLPIHK
jgi:hypothetical protein